MKALIIFVLVAGSLLAQSDSSNVQLSNGVPNVAYTRIFAYSGTNISYICTALSSQPTVLPIFVTNVTLASPAVATVSNHGYYFATGITQKILVYISGATGAWINLNGLKIFTPITTGAFNITNTDGTNFDSSGMGTWATQSISTSTRAPRAASSVWSVQKMIYNSDNVLVLAMNPVRVNTTQTGIASLSGGITGFSFPCQDPTIYQ